tara:strand:- start:85 stop:357 length:273 start_codon:yes stop_codon:yes gene_type:complete
MPNQYNQKHLWEVEVLNPVNNNVISKSVHSTINDIANTYKNINLNTWRNICMGRSKVYNNFIKVNKVQKKVEEPKVEINKKDVSVVVDFS